MDYGSKALEFLGVLEDEQNQANTEPRKLVGNLGLRRHFGVDQGVPIWVGGYSIAHRGNNLDCGLRGGNQELSSKRVVPVLIQLLVSGTCSMQIKKYEGERESLFNKLKE